MQTCTICNTCSSDSARVCENCSADLSQFSAAAVALARLRENPRVDTIRLVVSEEACPVCQEAAGNYSKQDVPPLPIQGCSNPEGCRCFYEPLLNVIYP